MLERYFERQCYNIFIGPIGFNEALLEPFAVLNRAPENPKFRISEISGSRSFRDNAKFRKMRKFGNSDFRNI